MSLPELSPEQLVKPRHFEARIALVYGTLLVSPGVIVPYFPLWLEASGFDAERIAVILAAPMFLRVITTPLLTAYADRASDRVNVLLGLVAATLLLSFGYFLPPVYGVVLAVSLAISVVMTPHGPLIDSIALSGVRRYGSNYTRMRIWGSIAFLTSNLMGGMVLARTGPQAVPVIISLGTAAGLLVVLAAPRLGRPRQASPLSVDALGDAPRLLSRYFLLMVTGAGLIAGSHGFMYGFASIYWKSIGLGDGLVGFLWAFAVMAEVGVFFFFTRVFGHLSVLRLLAISGTASMLRWLVYPLVWPLGLGAIGFVAVQGMHCLSMALLLIAVQNLIAETVDERRTGAAQGAAFFANGVSMAVVTLLSGPLYDRLGPWGFLAMIGVAGLGLALVLGAGPQPQSSARAGQTIEP